MSDDVIGQWIKRIQDVEKQGPLYWDSAVVVAVLKRIAAGDGPDKIEETDVDNVDAVPKEAT